MRKFGLIGYPLGHSFSKKYFAEKFEKEEIIDCVYENYPLENVESLLRLITDNIELVGLNVTIPYKEKVVQFLDEIDKDAEEIGAVNTIKISRSSEGSISLKGFNTDVYGFSRPLGAVLQTHHKKALILGTGGAAKAVAWVLSNYNIDFQFVSRRAKTSEYISYSDLSKRDILEHTIIINTSPVGMYPEIDAKPNIDYSGLTENHILYDLVYNPEETLFLKEGVRKKAITINGLPMLYLQAEKAWEIWNV
jgi:shikimate dehydrogenase